MRNPVRQWLMRVKLDQFGYALHEESDSDW